MQGEPCIRASNGIMPLSAVRSEKARASTKTGDVCSGESRMPQPGERSINGTPQYFSAPAV